jgi:hypothetical protein
MVQSARRLWVDDLPGLPILGTVCGTERGIKASFELMVTAKGCDHFRCFVSSAYSSATRHAAKIAELYLMRP